MNSSILYLLKFLTNDAFATVNTAVEFIPSINWSIPISLGGSASFVAILSYFIKKWINGTSEDIKELKINKVDDKTCVLKEESNQKLFNMIFDQLKEMNHDQKEIKDLVIDLRIKHGGSK